MTDAMTPCTGCAGTGAFDGADYEYPVPVQIRNTFVHCHPDQPGSLAEFFEERRVRSCPGSWVRPAGLKPVDEAREGQLPTSARTTIYESEDTSAASDTNEVDGDVLPPPLREPEARRKSEASWAYVEQIERIDYPELSPTPEPAMPQFEPSAPRAELHASAAPFQPSCEYAVHTSAGYMNQHPFNENGQSFVYAESSGHMLPTGSATGPHDCYAQQHNWQESFQCGTASSLYGHFSPEGKQACWSEQQQQQQQEQHQQGAAPAWEQQQQQQKLAPGPVANGEHFGMMGAVGASPFAVAGPHQAPYHSPSGAPFGLPAELPPCPPENLPPMFHSEAAPPAPPRTCGFAAAGAAAASPSSVQFQSYAAASSPSSVQFQSMPSLSPCPSPQLELGPRMVLQLSYAIDDFPAKAASAMAPLAGDLPSLGSALHSEGKCKPCAFLHTKGCGNGTACAFCHLCVPGEKKRRRKDKVECQKAMRVAQKGLLNRRL